MNRIFSRLPKNMENVEMRSMTYAQGNSQLNVMPQELFKNGFALVAVDQYQNGCALGFYTNDPSKNLKLRHDGAGTYGYNWQTVCLGETAFKILLENVGGNLENITIMDAIKVCFRKDNGHANGLAYALGRVPTSLYEDGTVKDLLSNVPQNLKNLEIYECRCALEKKENILLAERKADKIACENIQNKFHAYTQAFAREKV